MNLLREHVRRQWARWLWGGLMLLLTNATSMAMPQLLRFAVDTLSAGDPARLPDLKQIALTLILIAAGGMVFRTLSRVHLLYAARDVELDLRCRLYRHLTTLEPEFFAHHPVGDLMSRATNDLTQVRLMLGPGLLNLVNAIVAYAVAVPLMLAISWKLTLVTFAVYPPAVLLMRRLGRRLYVANRHQQQALGTLSSQAQESLAGATLIRAFAAEAHQEARFKQSNAAYLSANLGLAWTRSGMFRVSMSLSSVGTLATILWGGLDVLAGRLSLGDVVALVEYMALLSWPTFALGWVLSLWQRGAASMARMQEILSTEPRIVSGPQVPATPLQPRLEVEDLRVHYQGRPSLDGVSLTVPAGSTLGIVGPIGGGKSVLLRALLRLVASSGGRVRLGGVDIAELQLDALRRMFGYVPQNPSLFSKTVAENIAFGAPDKGAAAVAAAVQAAALTDDLAQLPDGLQTQVGERGISLSGGQKQRCAIARALLLEPPILLLDDALSAVDTATEAKILAALQPLRRGRTTLIVAHRLSAVAHAEQIVVLQAGQVREAGTHQTLLAQDGLYAAMARKQQSGGDTRLQEGP